VKSTADVTGGKPIAVLLQSISGVSAVNLLVALYDIHGGKREVLFFCFVPDTHEIPKKDIINVIYIQNDARSLPKRVNKWYSIYLLTRQQMVFHLFFALTVSIRS
jgi:hypothetical protein